MGDERSTICSVCVETSSDEIDTKRWAVQRDRPSSARAVWTSQNRTPGERVIVRVAFKRLGGYRAASLSLIVEKSNGYGETQRPRSPEPADALRTILQESLTKQELSKTFFGGMQRQITKFAALMTE